jgi:DNA-binding MarR family transcriptional regulator
MNISSKDLCFELLGLFGRIKATMAEVADSHGLTPIQLGTLYAINTGHTTMGKVAHLLHCDASNVTGIVDRLTHLELVNRQEDPKDRRVKTLQLTASGRQVLGEVVELLPSRLGCDRLSVEERENIHQAVIKLTLVELSPL